MDSACFSTSLPCLPTVWSLPPRIATLLSSVSHFMFQSPVLGSLFLGPPVSPFASSHPISLSGLWSPSTLCCPLGSLHYQPLPPTTFLFSSPFHPITLSLPSSPFSSSRLCLPCSFYSPSREDSFLGKRVGERRGLGQSKGRGLPRCGSDRERWVEKVGKWDTQAKMLERDHREKD